MKTVAELRQEGCIVRCVHIRRFKNGEMATKHDRLERGYDYSDSVMPTGGETEVHIRFPSGLEVQDYSVCNKADNYNKKLGVKICIGRLLKHLEEISK